MREKPKDPEEMTSAEVMASLLQKGGSASYNRIARPLTVRVSIVDLATLEAMAIVTKSTRNKVLAFLLQAGIEATREHLDNATIKKIEKAEGKFLKEFTSEEGMKKSVVDDSEVSE